ncbi:Nitroreductase family protein [Lentzea waywayandensis]|uniref:Nitroreductase family protein n=1 Tax=Lentzea waywayandensis TaxID=84724 RepID=A0A1I6D9D3_9PSEU|nr:Nitroreductase family protein [Lentzea waywayandensis]
MDRGQPDEVAVRAAVSLACRAPSVHNSQPWRWKLDERGLHLYADWSRSLPATDPHGADLIMSCGAALHHVRVGFASLGWRAIVHRLPDPGEADHLAAIEFDEQEPTASDVALAAAIPRRRTDRRAYSSWSVPRGLLEPLVDRASAEGVLAREVIDPSERHHLLSAITEAAVAQEADPEYRSEVHTWSGTRMGSTEGVPAANIPSGEHRYGDVQVRGFPSGELPQPEGSRLADDAGTLFVLSTSSDDTLSRLRAGEATSAVLLEATSAGLAACPLSQPLEVKHTKELVRDHVLGDSMSPQMVLRIGWAALNADPLPPTPRRPTSDVFDDLTREGA